MAKKDEQVETVEGTVATYVVLRAEQVDLEPDKVYTAWVEVASVTVPARTRRKTVIERALARAKLEVAGEMRVRVLDADSARESLITMEQPPPQLRIG